MKRLSVVLVATFALLGGACAGSDTEPNPAAFQGDVDQACSGRENVHTLDLVITPVRNSVAPGETAKFSARVVRKADLHQELKMALQKDDDGAVEQPVEGASVGITFSVDGTPVWGVGLTGADGTATIPVKVRRSAPSGSFDANATAFRDVAEGPCVHVAEEGSWHGEAALTVR